MSLVGIRTQECNISIHLDNRDSVGMKYYDNLALPLAVTVAAFIVEFVTAISAACATATDTDFSTNCW